MNPQGQSSTDLGSTRRVLLALQEARARLEAAERTAGEPIAVVGIGCRFPGGADGPDAYWRLLREGVDAVGEIPADRYDIDAYYDPTPGVPGKMYVREGAFLEAIDQFDALFFGISPREAISLDPQQRLLLEVAWEALEHAGQAPDPLHGSRSGVFIGIGRNDYAHRLLHGTLESISAWYATGNGLCYGPGRLAHVLDLQGPNIAIDTACSSSLLAVHFACQSLRLRECDLALAGGCHVHLSPQVAIMLSMSGALAADGRCKAFDASADGFGQGEGCGIVVLRRLSDAVSHHDHILALIRGSAINHDGHSSGLTVPNETAQEHLIRDALAHARVEPLEIGYVEAHGTGTSLGDLIEMEALAAVLGRDRSRDNPLRVGSVKTNLGHLEAAAGIAGLIKVVLALQHQEIPPHLHLRQPNPRVPWDELPIVVPTQRTPWGRGMSPRLAGVSSFGMSGANAHVVLQEAPPPPQPEPAERERPLHLVTLSAHSVAALQQQALRLETQVGNHADLPLEHVAFTANTGRAHFSVRVGLVAGSLTELSRSLSAVASGRIEPSVLSDDEGRPPSVVFLFSGQGSQYVQMGRQLYETQPTFRRSLAHCDDILRPHWQTPLCEILFPHEGGDRRLTQTLYTQPALFALEYALAELWRSWGLMPCAVMGHSMGEYVAACVAGVFSLEDALRLIAERARLMQSLPGGMMVAVFAEESRVREAIAAYANEVAVAAVNGSANVVVAGGNEPVQAVVSVLAAQGIAIRELNISHAFHSPMIDPMLAPFAAVARQVSYAPAGIELISNVTGSFHTQPLTAEYWVKHLRQPVRFADGMDTLARRGYRVFVEIGPGGTLLGMAGRHLADRSPVLLPSLRPGRDEWQQLLQSLARLYELGVPVDWMGFDRDYPRQRVALPTYPFERQRYWCEDAVNPPPVSRAQHENWTYRFSWHERTSPGGRSQNHRREPGRWLIFADRGGLGERLGRLLEERHDTCVHVNAGEQFVQTSATRWTINPARVADFTRLFRELPDASRWQGVVYLWTSETESPAELTVEELEASQLPGCGGVLHLVQTLVANDATGARLWLITRNAMSARSVQAAPPALAHASVWGLGKVIALEHPEIWGGMLDLASHPPTDEEAAELLVEMDGEGSEDHILLRDGKRFVGRLEPVAEPRSEVVPLRLDATYLITGGLGVLGLRVARWMVEQGARYLVLVGRREPSPPAQNMVAELRQMGATVIVASADVAKVVELRRVLAAVEASMPPLRGIVHTAGVFGYQAIRDLDGDTLRAVLRPKMAGAWLLHQLTSHLNLDLFVCFSSVASVWGSKGQAHYAAANHFLDALAHYRRQRGLPALSINWGPWDGGGMTSAEARSWLARMGVQSLTPEDALGAMQRHLGSSHPQIVIAHVDWARFQELYQAKRDRPLLEGLRPPGAREEALPALHSAPLTAQLTYLTAAERLDWLVVYLQREVAGVLGLADTQRPDPRKGFFHLGMDSLMAVELKNRLAMGLKVPLSATVVFDYPNIAELAAYLAEGVLGWERPAAEEGKPTARPDREVPLSASEQVPEDALPASIASKLARLESLIRET